MIRRDTTDGGICVLTFDRPDSGANIFDAATLTDLRGHVEAIEKDEKISGVILISAKKSIFIAGADLQTLLRQARSGEMRPFIAEGQEIFIRLAALNVPTVAAIHGACAGGGYEVTLACDYRIAFPMTRPHASVCPETTLGLVFHGLGRRHAFAAVDPGVDAAAEVILKGKLLSGRRSVEALAWSTKWCHAMCFLGRGPEKDFERQVESKGIRRQPLRVLTLNPISMQFPQRALEIIRANKSIPDSLRMELDAIVELPARPMPPKT